MAASVSGPPKNFPNLISLGVSSANFNATLSISGATLLPIAPCLKFAPAPSGINDFIVDAMIAALPAVARKSPPVPPIVLPSIEERSPAAPTLPVFPENIDLNLEPGFAAAPEAPAIRDSASAFESLFFPSWY